MTVKTVSDSTSSAGEQQLGLAAPPAAAALWSRAKLLSAYYVKTLTSISKCG